MPFVNRKGHIAHGKGAQGAFLDNAQFDTGGSACWYNGTTIVYQHGGDDGWYLAYFDTAVSPPTLTTAHVNGCDVLFGSDYGSWAAWKFGIGIFTSYGYTDPDGGLLAMGEDGSIAYRPDSEVPYGLKLRLKDGAVAHLSDGPAEDVAIVGEAQVIWHEANVLKSFGMPDIKVVAGGIWMPKAVWAADKWWIAYYSGMSGHVLHPIDAIDKGFKPITAPLNAWTDMVVLQNQLTMIRFAWSTSEGEAAGTVSYVDIDVSDAPDASLGSQGLTVKGVPDVRAVDEAGVRTLVSSASYGVAAAAEEVVELPIEIFPAYPAESGHGRIVHPILGAFDYEVKPDEWVNIDADAIIPPVWASSRTLTSTANVLWNGHIRDVVVEERWKSLGGLAMPITQLRMLMAIWTTPIDPDVGYVQWFPNYITSLGFKVLPVQLSAGGQGIAFDDVVNYKDEFGDPIGWITAPVTFQLKLVERLP